MLSDQKTDADPDRDEHNEENQVILLHGEWLTGYCALRIKMIENHRVIRTYYKKNLPTIEWRHL